MVRLHKKDHTAFSDPATEFEDWLAMSPGHGCVVCKWGLVICRYIAGRTRNLETNDARIYIPLKAGRLNYKPEVNLSLRI